MFPCIWFFGHVWQSRHCGVDVICHVWPTQVRRHRVVTGLLAWMNCQRMVVEIQDPFSKCCCHLLFSRAIQQRKRSCIPSASTLKWQIGLQTEQETARQSASLYSLHWHSYNVEKFSLRLYVFSNKANTSVKNGVKGVSFSWINL